MKIAGEQDYELTESYVRPDENKSIAGVNVEEIRYVFYKNRLTTIIIETDNEEASRDLLYELRSAYGDSEQPEDAMTQKWEGENVVAYYREEPTGESRIVLWFRPLIDELLKETKATGAKN